jgi:hypothetical protein
MATRFTFTRWLQQFQQDSTAIGDLARQVVRDTEWQDPTTLAAMESQLSGAGCALPLLEVARRAWNRYISDAAGVPRRQS